nr:MAG TPA: hypothetical protein [Caudoviricetes sp.]
MAKSFLVTCGKFFISSNISSSIFLGQFLGQFLLQSLLQNTFEKRSRLLEKL